MFLSRNNNRIRQEEEEEEPEVWPTFGPLVLVRSYLNQVTI